MRGRPVQDPPARRFFSLELPYRERLRAASARCFDGGDGPRVAVVVRHPRRRARGALRLPPAGGVARGSSRRRGPTRCAAASSSIPALNPLGLDTLAALRADLRRRPEPQLPGPRGGPAAAAHRRTPRCRRSPARRSSIDIHASNIFLREIPQVRITRAFAATLVPLARAHEPRPDLAARGRHRARGTPSRTASTPAACRAWWSEMGVGMRVTPAFAEQVVTGILHVWRALGVLAADVELEPTDARAARRRRRQRALPERRDVGPVRARRSTHWMAVRRGQRLGRIVSPLARRACSPRCARRSTACCSRCASTRSSTRARCWRASWRSPR